jgi:hypothetical protein
VHNPLHTPTVESPAEALRLGAPDVGYAIHYLARHQRLHHLTSRPADSKRFPYDRFILKESVFDPHLLMVPSLLASRLVPRFSRFVRPSPAFQDHCNRRHANRRVRHRANQSNACVRINHPSHLCTPAQHALRRRRVRGFFQLQVARRPYLAKAHSPALRSTDPNCQERDGCHLLPKSA